MKFRQIWSHWTCNLILPDGLLWHPPSRWPIRRSTAAAGNSIRNCPEEETYRSCRSEGSTTQWGSLKYLWLAKHSSILIRIWPYPYSFYTLVLGCSYKLIIIVRRPWILNVFKETITRLFFFISSYLILPIYLEQSSVEKILLKVGNDGIRTQVFLLWAPLSTVPPSTTTQCAFWKVILKGYPHAYFSKY